MTFGYAAPIQWDTRIKGRGVVGSGEAEELIHHAQLAWMPAEERRRYALTGPPPPDWFTAMQPAPWITEHVMSEGRKLAGASLVRLPPDSAAPDREPDVPPDVPPGTTPPVPAQRQPMSRPAAPGPARCLRSQGSRRAGTAARPARSAPAWTTAPPADTGSAAPPQTATAARPARPKTR